jgi:AcrR family transcriptional regulator
VTEKRESYFVEGHALAERLEEWARQIPDELRPPAGGSPRARILAAAARHFADDGFPQSTTRAIAVTAGVNQAMIHYYFQSKTRLYERVLSGMIIDLLTNLAASLVPRSSSPVEALVGFPERVVEVFASDPVRVRIFRREIGTGALHLRAVVDQLGPAGPRGFREIIQEYVDWARQSGALAGESASALLAFLLVHAYGAVLVEPLLQHVFATGDAQGHLERMVMSQREFVRRALTNPTKEGERP